ncbi:acyl-CoA synthetase [Allopusillimonas soli]|uniref:AMP-binding protein n=1 Tax=Allopusillimonas soli TaxID=659016 RepID=A0A853F5W0_9BURK|nr:AMP-binding protein [Allopusillimonas soli]NYT35925.1 AMP-binding protein [Allopusillimonas soli]TEA76281.1 acyl-CoA synthetase [Allopusillimonas soli]
MNETASVHQGGTLGDMIVTSIRRFPDRVAFIDGQTKISYQELGDLICKAVENFRRLGLRRGDGVIQLSGNRPETFVIMAAAYLMGLRSITLHTMGGIEDHKYIVQDAKAAVFIASSSYEERAREIHETCHDAVNHWFSHSCNSQFVDFWQVHNEGAAEELRCEAMPTDIVRLAYTGGTTGRPKGVMLTSRSLWMQATLLLAARPLPKDVILLCPTPISHGAGAMIVPTLWRGGTIILQQGFDPEKFLNAIEHHRASMTFLVPTMIYTLLDHPLCKRLDLSSLKILSYGASPMSPSRIREALEVFGPILMQSYGQTECPSNILHLSPSDHMREDATILESAGLPYPGVTVTLRDDDGNEVQDGQVGELCVRSPLVMEGYWNLPELTAQVTKGGWLHTGDMAFRDTHGYFHLVDRKKDMIISGGFNVYPKEVEDALATHPSVLAAAVIGVPDSKWGEAVKAIVVRRSGHDVDASTLIEFVKKSKGTVNTPKSIDFVDELPLTGLGKPDKKKLRHVYWHNLKRAVH